MEIGSLEFWADRHSTHPGRRPLHSHYYKVLRECGFLSIEVNINSLKIQICFYDIYIFPFSLFFFLFLGGVTRSCDPTGGKSDNSEILFYFMLIVCLI